MNGVEHGEIFPFKMGRKDDGHYVISPDGKWSGPWSNYDDAYEIARLAKLFRENNPELA